MTKPPDSVACDAISMHVAGEDERFAGQQEVDTFERLVGAYDPCVPVTGERMINAYLKFQQLGYAAYFRGERGVPAMIARRPHLAAMWAFGFDLAEFDAATRRCRCYCNKDYVWGKGYGTCPRIPQRRESK